MTDSLRGWFEALPALIAALGVLLVPGLIAIAPIRMGLMARAAMASTVSVAACGIAGLVFGLMGAPFQPWQPLIPALVLLAASWLVRRRWTTLALRREAVSSGWIVLVWVGAAVLIGIVAFAGIATPERISQTYDNVFHMSAIAAILDSGDASSLTLRTLIETDRTVAFYPAAWHTLVVMVVQLTGASVPVAANALWMAVCAVAWLPGVAWLAQVILRRYPSGLVAMIALPLGAAFGAMPYALLSWGTLYPTFLATTLIPVAIAIPVVAWNRLRTGSTDRAGIAIVASAGLALALAAIVFAQPRVLATWIVLIAPAIIGALASAFVRARRAGGASRRKAMRWLIAGLGGLVIVLVAGFAYVVFRLGLFERPLDDRLGGPQAQATQSIATGLWQVLSQSALTGVSGSATWPSILLAIVVAVGAVAAARVRSLRWIVVSYAVVAMLFALAAGSDDVLTKLATALWYKDRFRLSSALPIIGVTLATLGILVVASWLRRMSRRRGTGRVLPIGLTVTVVLTSAGVLLFTGTTAAIASVFRMPPSHAVDEVVSQAQIDFMARLPEIVPADQRVLGSPWDGSAWTQLYGDREPVFPHVNGQWDHDRLVVAAHLDDIDADPAICAALDALRVRYVLFHPHAFGGGDPAGDLFPGPHAAVEAGLFTEVASDGDSTLYRIDQCGPLR